MASSIRVLGLGHETSSDSCLPGASSWCFPPDHGLVLTNNSAVSTMNNVLPPPVTDDYYFAAPELGVHHPPPDYCYYSRPQVCVEREMSCVDDVGRSSRAVMSHGRRPSSRIGFRTRSEVDVLDDGFRWRKYGKKAVKTSPNPRNYYRCSVEGCGVKKRVERDCDDPRYVVTTYDGVHNHDAAAVPLGGGATSTSSYYRAPPPPSCLPAAWGMPQQLQHAAAAATAHSSESSY